MTPTPAALDAADASTPLPRRLLPPPPPTPSSRPAPAAEDTLPAGERPSAPLGVPALPPAAGRPAALAAPAAAPPAPATAALLAVCSALKGRPALSSVVLISLPTLAPTVATVAAAFSMARPVR